MNSLVAAVRDVLPARIVPPGWDAARDKLAARLRPHKARLRLTVAIALSLIFHALLILFLIPSAPKGFSGGGAGGDAYGAGQGIAVTLYTIDRAAMPALQVRPADPEDSAMTQLAVATAADAAVTTDMSPALPQLSPVMPTVVPDTTAKDGTDKATQAASAGGAGQAGTTAGAGDDLWAAIAPCWKRMAETDALAVTLEVSFAADGRLSVPPVIARDPAIGITDASLRSETTALQALAACGAYPMAGGRQNVRVNFPRP